MSHDYQTTGVSVTYAWTSAGDVRAYAYDRESALFARYGLEKTLTLLAQSNATRILVIGHSMGAQVVMDTQRQMAIRRVPEFFDKLGSVVLVAPDLDIDVFRTQAEAIASYDLPIFVFVSSRDRALRLSSLLRGTGQTRLGSITDSTALGNIPEGAKIRVIDVSDFDANGDRLQHFKAASSPSMIALFSGLGSAGLQMFRDAENRPGLLEGGLQATQDVAGAVLGRPQR